MIQLLDDFYTVRELLDLVVPEFVQRAPDGPWTDTSDGVPVAAPSDQWRRSLAEQKAALMLFQMVESGELTPWVMPFRTAYPANPPPDYLRQHCALDRSEAEKYLLACGIATEPPAQPAPPADPNEIVRRNASKGGKAKAEKAGSAAKREEIRAIWATGKYTSRERCAVEECDALGMGLSTAIRALRNTPEPPA